MDREEAIKMLESYKQAKCKGCCGHCGQCDFDEAIDVAIEALSAEPTDLISRADAIEAIWTSISRLSATNKINELPSAETHEIRTETHGVCSDLISRADVIEAVENLQTEQWIDSDIDYNNGLQSAIAEIKAFPSADRPTELLQDGTLKVNVKNGAEVNRVLVWGDDGCGGLYYADDRPSGEWVIVNKGLDIYICDQCGEVEQIQRIPIWDYCPNCGAKMKGESDERK